MLIIPAIDLQDGCVVRYVRGKTNKKVYSNDPVKTAKYWIKGGAKLLHVVDLGGAFSGTPKNLEFLKEIVRNSAVPVEFGGGIRKLEQIKSLLGAGVFRVVLGTKAVLDNAFLKEAINKFGNRIIISIDARQNNLLIEGWKSAHKKSDIITFAKGLKKLGFKEIIYTDTLRDGTLSGPNILALKRLLRETGLNIIASGGVRSLADLFKLKKLEKQGVSGVIIGKALYEGKFTLPQALKFA